jgi:hypothetical protein
MSSPLEKFIRDNREEFDGDGPSPKLWAKLEKELTPADKKGKVLAMKFLRFGVAAAILVLAGIGVFYLAFDKKPGGDGTMATTTGKGANQAVPQDKMLEEINPTYAKEVYHFTALIELKQTELKQIEKDNPVLYKQFITDINKLDSSYYALKNELPANPNREQLLEAMIQNLRLQSDLLNQQLNIIKQIKQSKKKTNEKNSNPA